MSWLKNTAGTTRQHRGLRSYTWTWGDTIGSALLLLVGWAAIWASHDAVQEVWQSILAWGWPRLGVGPASGVGLSSVSLLGQSWSVVALDISAPQPGRAALWTALLARLDARGHGHRALVLEPGRSLVGNAGVCLTEVLSLKPGAQKNFCIVDAAMNDLPRPALYEAWHGIVPLRTPRPGAAALTCDVVGPVCESGDWLGRDRQLAVQAGDRLAVLSAGAYCMSMASNYNSRPRAAEVLVDGHQARLIRRREQTSELWRDELP